MSLNLTRNHLAKVETKRGEVFQVQQRRISSFQCIYNNNQDHRSYLKNMRNHQGNKNLNKLDYHKHNNNLFLDINSSKICIRSKNNHINNNRFNSSLIKINRLEIFIKMQYQLGQII